MKEKESDLKKLFKKYAEMVATDERNCSGQVETPALMAITYVG